MTEDAGCDVAPQKWGHDSTEVLMERVTAGIMSDSGDDTTQEIADAALTELAERLKAAELRQRQGAREYDEALEKLEAERQTVRELRRCLAFFDPGDDADAAIAFARRLNPEWDSLAGDDA